jgi:hypothetical protein
MPDSEPVEALSFSSMLREVLRLAETRSFVASDPAPAPQGASADDAAMAASSEALQWRATIASRA